jgi:ankyrin repeat protein
MPFMYAALYGDMVLLEQLLRKGANPNVRNDTGSTALLLAATNLEKTRVLLAHGGRSERALSPFRPRMLS